MSKLLFWNPAKKCCEKTMLAVCGAVKNSRGAGSDCGTTAGKEGEGMQGRGPSAIGHFEV